MLSLQNNFRLPAGIRTTETKAGPPPPEACRPLPMQEYDLYFGQFSQPRKHEVGGGRHRRKGNAFGNKYVDGRRRRLPKFLTDVIQVFNPTPQLVTALSDNLSQARKAADMKRTTGIKKGISAENPFAGLSKATIERLLMEAKFLPLYGHQGNYIYPDKRIAIFIHDAAPAKEKHGDILGPHVDVWEYPDDFGRHIDRGMSHSEFWAFRNPAFKIRLPMAGGRVDATSVGLPAYFNCEA